MPTTTQRVQTTDSPFLKTTVGTLPNVPEYKPIIHYTHSPERKMKNFSFLFFFFRGETLKEARWSRHYHKGWVWSGERVKSQAPLWDIQPHRSLCQLFVLYSHQFRTGCIKQVLTSALRQLNMLRFYLRGLKLLDRSQYLCFPFC